VICLRRLGDVLLATPLIRSLRTAYPEARIDALVFASTAAALEGNPDLDQVIAWPTHAGLGQTWRIARPLFRRYDLAVSVTASDRAQFLAVWASSHRAVTVQAGFERAWLNPLRVTYAPGSLHTVKQGLRLAELLGVATVPDVVPPRAGSNARIVDLLGANWAARRFAVVHPAPMYRYKAWTFDGWRDLIEALHRRGLRVLLSGGPGAEEQALVAALLDVSRGTNDALGDALASLAGKLSLGELADVLAHAAVFVGPDTSITHLASACGTQVIALFGPSSPVAWAPWPQGWSGDEDSPWHLTAPVQRIGKVTVLQGAMGRWPGCIPCLQEGCGRHLSSVSDCLETLPLSRVLDAVDQVLGAVVPGPAARAPA